MADVIADAIVGRGDGWVPLYAGDAPAAAAVQAQLAQRGVAYRIDQSMAVGASAITVLVHEQTLPAARQAIASLGSSTATDVNRLRGTEATRLLCAEAVLGKLRRTAWMSRWRQKSAAVAPELGVDARLLAKVCVFMNRRDFRYELLIGVMLPLVILSSTTLPVLAYFVISMAVFLTLPVVLFTKWYSERWSLAVPFSRAQWDSAAAEQQFECELPREIASKTADPDHNVVVYSAYAPFVGAGGHLDGWSFVIDTTKPSEELGAAKVPRPFTSAQLYESVIGKIRELYVPAMEIRDCLFVSGRDIRNDREILPDIYRHPVQRVSPARIERLRTDNAGSQARWYPWIRIYDANSEVILSVFLRFHIQGKHLFLEMARHVVSPVAADCREIDRIGPPTVRSIAGLAAKALIASPVASYYFLFCLAARGLSALYRVLGFDEREHRRAIRGTPLYNYGAAASIREEASSGVYAHYFEQIDTQMYVKMLDVTILDSVLEFLADHNVDTSDLKEQSTTVLNSGIIVHGGDVKAGSLAVGQQAKATTLQKLGARTRGMRRKAAGATA